MTEERYPIEIIQGVEGFCIGLNNYRIAGPKPWGGGTVVKQWHISAADLRRAIPELFGPDPQGDSGKPDLTPEPVSDPYKLGSVPRDAA